MKISSFCLTIVNKNRHKSFDKPYQRSFWSFSHLRLRALDLKFFFGVRNILFNFIHISWPNICSYFNLIFLQTSYIELSTKRCVADPSQIKNPTEWACWAFSAVTRYICKETSQALQRRSLDGCSHFLMEGFFWLWFIPGGYVVYLPFTHAKPLTLLLTSSRLIYYCFQFHWFVGNCCWLICFCLSPYPPGGVTESSDLSVDCATSCFLFNCSFGQIHWSIVQRRSSFSIVRLVRSIGWLRNFALPFNCSLGQIYWLIVQRRASFSIAPVNLGGSSSVMPSQATNISSTAISWGSEEPSISLFDSSLTSSFLLPCRLFCLDDAVSTWMVHSSVVLFSAPEIRL